VRDDADLPTKAFMVGFFPARLWPYGRCRRHSFQGPCPSDARTIWEEGLAYRLKNLRQRAQVKPGRAGQSIAQYTRNTDMNRADLMALIAGCRGRPRSGSMRFATVLAAIPIWLACDMLLDRTRESDEVSDRQGIISQEPVVIHRLMLNDDGFGNGHSKMQSVESIGVVT